MIPFFDENTNQKLLKAEVRVEPGMYKYKYKINNTDWTIDLRSPVIVNNDGSINNYVKVVKEILPDRDVVLTHATWTYKEIEASGDRLEGHTIQFNNNKLYIFGGSKPNGQIFHNF